jgi:hypothetical protein
MCKEQVFARRAKEAVDFGTIEGHHTRQSRIAGEMEVRRQAGGST